MSDTGKGMATAVAAAVAAHVEPEEPEQHDLLGLPEPKTLQGQAVLARRGPGRPPGARNKRTQRAVEWLLSVHQDPRAVLLAIAEASVDELVARLGCKPLEALQEKRLAAIGVLPYVAQRQPLAVDITDHKIIHLHIADGEVEAGDADAGGVGLTARIIEGDIVKIEAGQGDP